MGRTGRKTQRAPKQNLDVVSNPNPVIVEETTDATESNGNVAEEPKAEMKPRVQQPEQQPEQKRRDPIFDEFYGDLLYGQQVVVLTLVLYGPKAATQKRVEMQQELVSYLRARGQRIERSVFRDIRLSEIATELKVPQRAVTMESNGFTVENPEKFIQRLQVNAARNVELKSERSSALFEELGRLRDQHRDDERSQAVYLRRKEQEKRQREAQVPATGESTERSYSDPGQESKLGDIASEELQATGTEG